VSEGHVRGRTRGARAIASEEPKDVHSDGDADDTQSRRECAGGAGGGRNDSIKSGQREALVRGRKPADFRQTAGEDAERVPIVTIAATTSRIAK
jgi:hypothetical protein